MKAIKGQLQILDREKGQAYSTDWGTLFILIVARESKVQASLGNAGWRGTRSSKPQGIVDECLCLALTEMIGWIGACFIELLFSALAVRWTYQ
jgi:hypothetical protein